MRVVRVLDCVHWMWNDHGKTCFAVFEQVSKHRTDALVDSISYGYFERYKMEDLVRFRFSRFQNTLALLPSQVFALLLNRVLQLLVFNLSSYYFKKLLQWLLRNHGLSLSTLEPMIFLYLLWRLHGRGIQWSRTTFGRMWTGHLLRLKSLLKVEALTAESKTSKPSYVTTEMVLGVTILPRSMVRMRIERSEMPVGFVRGEVAREFAYTMTRAKYASNKGTYLSWLKYFTEWAGQNSACKLAALFAYWLLYFVFPSPPDDGLTPSCSPYWPSWLKRSQLPWDRGFWALSSTSLDIV